MLHNTPLVIFIPTERELKTIFGSIADKTENDISFTMIKNTPVVVTGIGKVNGAITGTAFFSKYRPEQAILTGICGAYKASGLNVGETVSINTDYFVDEASFDGKNLMSLEEKGMPICEKGKAEFQTIVGYKIVSSNTVSLIPNTVELSELYRLKTKASVENMEGAAFGLAASKYGIKPYQIRTISNYCGAKEIQDWNIKLAAENLRQALFKIIK